MSEKKTMLRRTLQLGRLKSRAFYDGARRLWRCVPSFRRCEKVTPTFANPRSIISHFYWSSVRRCENTITTESIRDEECLCYIDYSFVVK